MREFRLVTYPYPGSIALADEQWGEAGERITGPWAPARGVRYLLCKMFVRHTNRKGPGLARIDYRTTETGE